MNATIRLLVALVTICALGLVAGVVIVSMQAVATEKRLSALEEYVAGKGEQRDAENARQNELIDQAVCNVLDQLPAGGRLDTVRAAYRCGPGLTIPPEAATPGASATTSPGAAPRQDQPSTEGASNGTTAEPSATQTPASDAPAPPSTTTPAPQAIPTAALPTTAPAPPPDRGPVTDLMCGLLPPLCPP